MNQQPEQAGTEPRVQTVVGWTGHRRLSNPEAVAQAVQRVLDTLAERAGGPERLLGVGSAAIGADLLFCDAMAKQDIAMILFVPQAIEDFEQDADPDDRRRVRQAVDRADAVEFPERSNLSQNEVYMECGVRTVHECDVLVAVWDNKPARGLGGTGDIVAYATRTGHPVILIDEATGDITWPDELADEPPIADNDRPRPLRDADDVADRYAALDASAQRMARPTRHLLLRVIMLHLGASALIIIALAVYPELKAIDGWGKQAAKWVVGLSTAFEVLALMIAMVMVLRHGDKHHQWIDDRVKAEMCRSCLALWNVPRWVVSGPITPLVGMRSFARELNLAWRLNPPAEPDLTRVQTAYASRVESERFSGRIADQVDYFTTQADRSRRKSARYHHLATSSTLAAIVIGMVTLVLMVWTDHAHGLLYAAIKGVAVALPLISAALLSLATAGDHSRRSARYTEIADQLRSLDTSVRSAATWPDLGRSIETVEHMLLAEAAEWHAFQRFVGEPHA